LVSVVFAAKLVTVIASANIKVAAPEMNLR